MRRFLLFLLILSLLVAVPAYAQNPPTPTALPPGVPYVFVPDEYSLWASAPFAIQYWNMLGDARTVVQALILIVVIIIGVAVLMNWRKTFTRKDEEA